MKSSHVSLSVRSQEISGSTVQLPLTVSYEGISLRGFRFWVHVQDVVYSLRQFGEPIRQQIFNITHDALELIELEILCCCLSVCL